MCVCCVCERERERDEDLMLDIGFKKGGYNFLYK